MMKYTHYSSIDAKWSSTLPSHWSYVPLRHVFVERKEINNPVICSDILSLTNTSGVIPYSQKGNMGNKQKDDLSTYHIAHTNDLVLNSMNVIIGSSGVSKYHGCVSPVYYTLSIRNDDNVQYYGYLFKIPPFYQSLKPLGNGILEIRLRIPMNKLNTVMLPVPPRAEQDQIVRYLDWQVARINKLIHGYQQQIKLLEERKRSFVNSLMAGLLDNTQTRSLKFALDFVVDCPHETPEYDPNGEYLVIRTADQDYGELRSSEEMYRLTQTEYEKRTRRKALDKDDIVYGREGERWGLACLVPESNQYCLGQRMVQLRCNKSILHPLFAMWMLNSQYVYQQGLDAMFGSTSPHVNVATICNYKVAIPSLDRQIEIAKKIQNEIEKINVLAQRINEKVDLLKEYRTRLISDVVTGQLDVRGVVIPDYEAEADTEEAENEDAEQEVDADGESDE